MNKLKIEYVDINSIKPYKGNAKLHPEEQIEQIKKSIEQFGMDDPIGIWKDEIVEGHGRLIACKELGYTEVPIIRLDHLSDEERKAYTLAHNKLTMNSDFDLDILNDELDDILNIDMSDFGFDLDLEDEEEKEIIEDEVPEVPEEPKAKLGDIYQLGNHRLMCGDSTKEEDVTKLMNGVKADMVFTDPPYGVSYTGGVIHGNKINTDHKREMLKNDDVDIYSDFIPLLNKIIDDGAIYIFYATCNSYELLKPLKENDIELNSIIVWNKINTGYADMNSNYKNKYEPCVYCKRKGHKLNFVGPTTENTVWDIEKDRDNKLHPTQKPIKVPARAISNSSNIDGKVLDLFGGSGSTLIACEQLNRKCYMMELDPHYIDVIIQRWENFTGEKAIKLN
jgi:site-specific DNA-methyltransferase (adenine-specific)